MCFGVAHSFLRAQSKPVEIPIGKVPSSYKASCMKPPLIEKVIGITLLLFILFPYSAQAETPAYVNTIFRNGDCGLFVEDPHISSSKLKNKEVGIKVNVTSKCQYVQQKVEFQIELLKKGALGWVSVKHFSREITKPKPSPFKVEIKDAFIPCSNFKATIFLARASAKVTVGGKIYATPLVYSNQSPPIKCGF